MVSLRRHFVPNPVLIHSTRNRPKCDRTLSVHTRYDDTAESGELVKGLRPTRVIYPNGRVVRYEYADEASSSSSSGAAVPDPDDCLNRIKFIADDDNGAVGTHLEEYTRLGLSTIVRVDYTEPQIRYDLAHGVGNDPYAGLDRFGRVVDLLWRNYGTAEDVVRIKHGYDRAGNRLYREDPVAASHGVDLDEAYSYDGLYQLKTFVRGALNAQRTAIASPTFRQAWEFDTTGNWSRFREDKDGDGRWDLDQTRQHNAANELTSLESKIGDVWISPLHDRNGNMIRIPQPKDPTKQFTLRYDAWNRLVRVSDPAGPVADYSYDGRNFRIVKVVHRDPSDPIPGEEAASRYPETRHFYYNDQWQCLEERASSSPSVLPHSLSADRQFVWGLRYIDDLLLRDRHTQPFGDLGATASGLDERLYAVQDLNWNVVAIADTSGGVAERVSYAPYGKRTFLTRTLRDRAWSSYTSDTLFTGRCLDRETELYQYRMRSYSPEIGRFLRRDPRGSLEGLNMYAYVHSHPTKSFDPLGMAELDFSPDPIASAPWYPGIEALSAPLFGETLMVQERIHCWCCGISRWPPPATGNDWPVDYYMFCRIKAEYRILIYTHNIRDFGDEAGGPISPKGVYGHEQRHVQNRKKFLEDVQKYLTGLEDFIAKNGGVTNEMCKQFASNAQLATQQKYQAFGQREKLHQNAEHPIATKFDYEPIGEMPINPTALPAHHTTTPKMPQAHDTAPLPDGHHTGPQTASSS